MSFFDDASLIFLPSGQAGKDGKAYSMKPTNGDGDFTFSRGSNLTATRIDSNGLIAKGRENLITQSNDLSDFTPQGLTTTPNQADPFGGNNATLFTENLSGGNHRFYLLNVPSSSAVHTYSMYIKYSGRSRFKLVINGGNPNATFNTQTGAHITDSGNIIDYKTESIGNDWHRVSFASVCSGWVGGYFVNDSGQDSYTGDGTSGVVLFGAQVELGLVATEYISSGASSGKGGLLEHSPRFDYSGGASCASLLLERSRTNEIGYSEYFEGWTPQGSPTITSNYGTSPEGLQNSSRLIYTTDSDYIETSVTNTSGVFTLYAKGTGNLILTDSGANASSTTALTSSYQRIELYFSTNTTTLQIKTDSSGLDAEVYAAQFENATYKTSYIPNHSGGSVTRDADITSVTSVSDLIGQTEGTMYCEFEYNGAADSGVYNRIIGLGTGVTQNRILLAKNDTTAELVAFAVSGGTTQVFQAISGTSIIGHHKVAMSYKANEYKVYLDGELEFTDTSASVPATTDVYIGTAEDSTTYNELGGVVKQAIIFKEVLSEDDCKALTTI